jgi:hypothetical protein
MLSWPSPAAADSWADPRKTVVHSPNRQARLTVTPGDGWLREEGAATKRPTATAVLERRIDGGWRRAWAGPLVNEVAPASVLVSDDGRYTITFDNWGSIGLGDNVVVIYDGGGRLIRSLSLLDFLPEYYARALSRTFGSLFWGGDHHFSSDGLRLVLEVAEPSEQLFLGGGDHLDVELELATGRLIPPSGPAWEAALKAGATIYAARLKAQAEADAWSNAPIAAPASGGRTDWSRYLDEAFYRLDPDWQTAPPRSAALPEPGADDYALWLEFLRRTLIGKPDPEGDSRLFGSPSQENLVAVLEEFAVKIRPGALRGVRVYVVVSAPLVERATAALAQTGATFIPLDPTRAIPQRVERMRTPAEAEPGRGE